MALGTLDTLAPPDFMRSAGNYLSYLLFRLAWSVGRLLGLERLRRLLEALGRTVARFDWRRRDVVADNLRSAFPQWSEARIATTAARVYANWGRIAAEMVHVAAIADEQALARLGPVFEAIDDVAAEGRALLLLTAHTGNFELLSRLCGLSGRRVVVFNRPMHNRFIARFLAAERAKAGVGELNRALDLREALRELRRGVLLAVPLDQNQAPGRGLFVNMFGRKAATSPLLARLSVSTGAPVLPVFSVWRDDKLVPVIGDVIWPEDVGPTEPGRRAKELRLTALTARYTAEIERVVRLYPDQWNWMHSRWRTRPEPVREAEKGD